MLQLFYSSSRLSFANLMYVYQQTVAVAGNRDYPRIPPTEQVIRAENDLFAYINTMFRTDANALCAVWQVQGAYKSALRLESYGDGLLLNSLETAPGERRTGFALALVTAVLDRFPDQKIYSHISKRNIASIALHEKCGFCKIKDQAVLLDGSVVSHMETYCRIPIEDD